MTDSAELAPEEEVVIQALARLVDATPPAGNLAVRFRQRLATEPEPGRSRRFPLWQTAIAASLFVALGVGWLIEWRTHQRTVRDLQVALTSALTDLSEVKRFQAITLAGDSHVRDDQVIVTLTQVLLSDPNTNVRVAAIEALAQLADPGVLLTISHQVLADNPSVFVQAALVRAADQLTPAGRRELLQAMLRRADLLPTLRTAAEARLAS